MDRNDEIARLEEDLNMAYDSLDERLRRLEEKQSDDVAVFGVVATIIIGVVQIVIALLK
ncbi:MAG: hypothetical protein IJM68_03980 [Synergistaceae bacterium]|nr:hypothetical protein [Synergistaceae bacterium]